MEHGGNPAELWNDCHRGDWMLWYAFLAKVDIRLIVLTVCATVREALVCVPEGEERPLHAIHAAEAWARGEATLAELVVARDAVSDAIVEASTASIITTACAGTALNNNVTHEDNATCDAITAVLFAANIVVPSINDDDFTPERAALVCCAVVSAVDAIDVADVDPDADTADPAWASLIVRAYIPWATITK